ncbi:SNF-related serine/threonine-protein kinase-like [Acanthaster planci]|uniref:SNF-related serine/threonine-protein kinase n=1 Tax=Acanthaster planci TaxID=133434 RepID=A0A8B7XQL7_ACAPL|nr:SNF-related serine/threonine-protein kinase-like [Acanthaster planci]
MSGAAAGYKSSYDGKIAGMYDLEETLGRGHFAIVKLARHVFTGQKVAVKVIDKNKLDDISRAHLFQEVRCMKLVQHPNVVRLYEVIDTQTKLYLILELGDGGDMYDYIMQHENGLSQDLARNYFSQIVSAISYCHKLHVVHRDLKPENVIFFKKQGVVKLTDFGFSNLYRPGEKLETSCGSLAYSAPEILLGDSYDAPAVDVWSLGVLLYMLVCGEPPFNETNDSETLTMIMDCKYFLPDHISEDCKNLISSMLQRDPEKRLTLEQIVNSAWLKQGGAAKQMEPLITRHDITDSVHESIMERMISGNIADRTTIMKSLESDSYDHITATYFLLAERKLKKQVGDLTTEDNSLRRHSAVQPQLASLALSPRTPLPDHPTLEKPINNNIGHLCSPVAAQPSPAATPIPIPTPPLAVSPALARSSSEEEVSCSPRRHRMEREHLTIHPRHGRSIVKEGLQSLEEEEFQHIADEEMELTTESLVSPSSAATAAGSSPSDGSWGKARRPQGANARPNNPATRLNPTVLNQITEEEDEQESDDEKSGGLDRPFVTRQIRHRKTLPSKDTPHQIKPSTKVAARGGYSSSDASDEDTETRRRSEKFDLPSKGQRRGSKDGPPNGGSSSGAGSNNAGPGAAAGGGKYTGSNSSGGGTGGDNHSSSNPGGGNAYERKKSNELRESLKQSNLSMNSSNSSSSYSISKFAIDPNNTTPSDSDDPSADSTVKAWPKKDNLSHSDSNLYIIPRDAEKSNLPNGSSPAKKQLKRDSSNLAGERNDPDLNSNAAAAKPTKGRNKEIRKKRNRIGSTDTDESPLKPGAKSDSSCCRLV